jgi:hypothetical protein
MEQQYIYWLVTAIVIMVAFVLTTFNAKHWIGDGRYLCTNCKFNTAEDCLKRERPTALDCTAYRPENTSNPASESTLENPL